MFQSVESDRLFPLIHLNCSIFPSLCLFFSLLRPLNYSWRSSYPPFQVGNRHLDFYGQRMAEFDAVNSNRMRPDLFEVGASAT